MIGSAWNGCVATIILSHSIVFFWSVWIINLSLLNDDIIDEFYSIIIKQKEKNNNYQIIEEENIKIISKKITKKVENKKFKIIKLTRLQRQILKSIL